MIKTIKLSYKSNGIKEKTIVKTFFEKAGIRVIESCYDKPVDLREALALLKIKTVPNNFIMTDAEIILTDDLNDKRLNKPFDVDKITVEIDCKNAPKNEQGIIDRKWLLKTVLKQIENPKNNISGPIKINYREVLKNEQGLINGSWLINETLNQLSERGLLDKKQENDLRELAEIFIDTDYNNSLMLANYADLLKEKKLVELAVECYRKFIHKTSEKYYVSKTNFHVGYALLDACCSINLLRKGVNETTLYPWPQIKGVADELKGLAGGVLDRPISMLLALTKLHVLSDFDGAYREILEVERDAGRFDADIRRFHGILFDNGFDSDREVALKHYKEAISLFSTDYESWFRISNYYVKAKKGNATGVSSRVVIKILENGYTSNELNPEETFIFFSSAIRVGERAEWENDYQAALKYYNLAKVAIERLKDSSYFKELNIKTNYEDLTNKIDERFGTKRLEKGFERCHNSLAL